MPVLQWVLLDFVAANICVYFQYLFMHFVCANIFGAIVLKPRFKIDAVIMIICSIVIIINSVLTLKVLTASLPYDCGPCEIKVVFNHTWFASYLRLRQVAQGARTPKWLNQRQGIGTTSGDFLKHPILVWVSAEHFCLFKYYHVKSTVCRIWSNQVYNR